MIIFYICQINVKIMKKGFIDKILELLYSSKWVMISFIILSILIAVLILIGMPYEKTIILYLLVSSFFGTYLITAVLLVPAGLFFRIFGRKIPKSLSDFFGLIINICSFFCLSCFLPSSIITLVFFFSLFKVSFFLFLPVFAITIYLQHNITNNNKIISTETDINTIQTFRLEWSKKRLKWIVLLFILLSCLLILGICEHKSFSIIDCIAISTYYLFLTYQIFIAPYRNTYSKEYQNKNFVFFLRSFRLDNTVESDVISAINDGLNYTMKNRLRVLRIGNPSLTMYDSTFGTDTFFLPTHDWQPVVRKYINDSKTVVVLINIPKSEETAEVSSVQFTQGVIWELYNNIEHRDKFIYCIDKISNQKSADYLAMLDEEKKGHTLTKCIVSLLDHAQSTTFEEDRCVFTYDGRKCLIFNKLKSAVKHTLDQMLSYDETFVEFNIDKITAL